MKTSLYKALVILITTFMISCESYLIHGDLDGFWQVANLENKETGVITDYNGDVYYSFQRELVLVTYILPHRPQGQIKENYIAYFTHQGDSIVMTDFRIYLDKEAKQAPLSKLEKFGLYSTHNAFHIDILDKSSLILDSDKARITLRKY